MRVVRRTLACGVVLMALVAPAAGRADTLCLLGSTEYNGPGNNNDEAWAVGIDGMGNVIVAGDEYGTSGFNNWRVRKYNAELTTLLASTDYDGPVEDVDLALALAIDGSGNVLVGGEERAPGATFNWRVRKYNAGLTTLLASTDYNGPGDADDMARSLIVDGSGNIVVAGHETGASGGYNWRVRKYNAGLTTLLASTDYNGPGNGYDLAQSVALDGSGNVVVVGAEAGVVGGYNWRVRKYDAGLTTLLASTDYNGPGNGGDGANGVGFDGSGNVVVAGSETGVVGGSNWRVRKYDAGLTTLLASTDYNGPGNGTDTLMSVVVDGLGNVVAAGYETGASGGYNWRVREYDAGLTTLLASTDYNGPGNGDDLSVALAHDAFGSIVVAGYEAGTSGANNWRVRRYGFANAFPQFSVVKTQTGGKGVGEAVDYAIVVTNAGSATILDMTVVDTIPSVVVNVSTDSPPVFPGPLVTSVTTGTRYVWSGTGLNMSPGESFTFTITGTVGFVCSMATVSNTAYVVGKSFWSELGMYSNAAEGMIQPPVAGIAAQKTQTPALPTIGGPVTYRIVVANTGSATLASLTVVDTISPIIASTVTAQPPGFGAAVVTQVAPSGSRFVWSGTGLNMTPGTAYTFTVTGTVGVPCADTALSSTAYAVGSWSCGSVSQFTGAPSFAVAGPGSVLASMALARTPASPANGSSVTYRIVVTNTGTATITAVMIADTLPAAVTLTGHDDGGLTWVSNPPLRAWNGSGLMFSPGTTMTVTVTGTVSATYAGNVTNVASVRTSNDCAGGQNAGQDSFAVAGPGGPQNPANLKPGEAIVAGGKKGPIDPTKNEKAKIHLWPTGPGEIRIRIYNWLAVQVAEITASTGGNHVEVVQWEGTDSGGAVVPPGGYKLLVEAPGVNARLTVAVLY